MGHVGVRVGKALADIPWQEFVRLCICAPQEGSRTRCSKWVG